MVADCAARHGSSKATAKQINSLAYDPRRFELLSADAQRLDTGAYIVRPKKRARADLAKRRREADQMFAAQMLISIKSVLKWLDLETSFLVNNAFNFEILSSVLLGSKNRTWVGNRAERWHTS